MYSRGGRGVEHNYAEAVRWWRLAALNQATKIVIEPHRSRVTHLI